MSAHATDSAQQSWPINVDQPIRGRSEDKLGRAAFAEALANQIASAPTEGSFVVGLLGAWGSGKTSILNMVSEVLTNRPDVVVLRFNPWLFSGTEQLVQHFFRELASQLGEKTDERLHTLGNALVEYAELFDPFRFIPIVGSWVDKISGTVKAVGIYLARRGRKTSSVETQRQLLDAALRALGKRVVVIIDDIDRLRREEIRDVMRLVRLIADFPYTAYLLAFDRLRVEEALTEVEGDGRAYLEKILQVTHDVPLMHEPDLAGLILAELETILKDRRVGPFNETDWVNIFNLVMRPLFETVRDLRRYINALPVTMQAVGDEVALVDVLVLEAVRVLTPDVFARFATSLEALTPASYYMGTGPNEAHAAEMKRRVEALISAGGKHSNAIRQMIIRVFPAGRQYLENYGYGGESLKRWRRERRVAHPEVFRFYLQKKLPEGTLPARTVQMIFDSLGNEEALSSIVPACDSETLEHVLKRLEDYEEEFRPEVAEVAVRVLMNQTGRLREGRRNLLDYGADLQLERVVLRLLRRVEDERERLSIVERVLPSLTTLTAKHELIGLVSHKEHVGHRLVSQEDSVRLERELREDILRSSEEKLCEERDLARLLGGLAGTGETGDVAFVNHALAGDRVFLRFLRSSLTSSQAQTVGDVALRTEFRLPWDWLTSFLREDVLVRRIREVSSSAAPDSLDERSALALEVARRYAEGWRPERP